MSVCAGWCMSLSNLFGGVKRCVQCGEVRGLGSFLVDGQVRDVCGECRTRAKKEMDKVRQPSYALAKDDWPPMPEILKNQYWRSHAND